MQGPIGFIGLGIMGRPMAKNLLKAGHALVVHNRSQAAVQDLVGQGAKAADSSAAVARAAGDLVITMLPNHNIVREVILGAALDTLPRLEGPFDLVFIDADKRSNPDYLAAALRLSRPGTVIVCDNVVRDGAITDAASRDPGVVGTRRLFEMLAAEPRLTGTAVQTVGAKGWDGFAIAVVD